VPEVRVQWQLIWHTVSSAFLPPQKVSGCSPVRQDVLCILPMDKLSATGITTLMIVVPNLPISEYGRAAGPDVVLFILFRCLQIQVDG
jgi:hypothetical protein